MATYARSEAHGWLGRGASESKREGGQTDIGNAIKPFYGDEAGNKLAALLHEHIVGAANVLAAAKGTRSTTRSSGWPIC